jgi:small subunit ribosomal protein S1
MLTPKPEDFNWDLAGDKGFGSSYTAAEKQEIAALYEGTLSEVTEKQVLSGVVVGITERDVIINIGFKSDGLIPVSEFRDVEGGVKVGEEYDVYVEDQENAAGQLVLSRRKARIVKAWENIQGALDNDLIIEALVKRRTKGGLIVDLFGVEAFLPGSQIDVKPIRDFDIFVDRKRYRETKSGNLE